MKQVRIKQRVASLVGRAGREGEDIEFALESTLAQLENEHSFKYMERFVQVTVDPQANNNPRVIEVPESLKEIEWVRRQKDDGEFVFLQQIDPDQLIEVKKGQPGFYWLDGREYIWLDREVEEKTALEMSYSRYTKWDSADDFEPHLYRMAPGLIVAQAALNLSANADTSAADPRRLQAMRDENLRAVLAADHQYRFSDFPMKMENPDFGEQ